MRAAMAALLWLQLAIGAGGQLPDEPLCGPEDVNSDGSVGVGDLLLVLSAFGGSDAAADINGDGEVKVRDVLLVLEAFGLPCRLAGGSPAPPPAAAGGGGDDCGPRQIRLAPGSICLNCPTYQLANPDHTACVPDLTPPPPPPPPPAFILGSQSDNARCVDMDPIAGYEQRTFCVHVPYVELPAGSDGAALIMFLHGYTQTGQETDNYLHLRQLSDDRGFIAVTPDGWNCNYGCEPFWCSSDASWHESVDDSGFLRALIELVQAQFPVDPRKIYVGGHSMGAFMSYRMACDHADLVAGIASLAGQSEWIPTGGVRDSCTGASDSAIPDACGCVMGETGWSSTTGGCSAGSTTNDEEAAACLESLTLQQLMSRARGLGVRSDAIDELTVEYGVDAKTAAIDLVGQALQAVPVPVAGSTACGATQVAPCPQQLGHTQCTMEYTCRPASPVHVLQIHGDADEMVAYSAHGRGAAGSVSRWADFNGCDASPSVVPPLADAPAGFDDLATPAGDDTTVTRHGNCPAGGSAELWTLAGQGHFPVLCAEAVHGRDTCAAGFRRGVAETLRLSARMADWFLARPKP